MKARSVRALALCSMSFVAACDAGGSKGPGVAIAVAPLTLPNVAEVCYGLTVYNSDPTVDGAQTVWSQPNVCSGQYGNNVGGDVTFIGTCDADTPNPNNNLNYVKLVLNTVEVQPGRGSLPADIKNILDDQATVAISGDGDADFENPCLGTAGCVLSFECLENADVQVEFNLTIMADADQGFFDIAVNFEDIFCSGKYDTCYATDDAGTDIDESKWVELLFGDDATAATPVDGPGRDRTGVLALACTGGPDTAAAGNREGIDYDTTLHYSQVTLTCSNGTTTNTIDLPLNLAAGNHDVAVAWGGAIGTQSLQYATYLGTEELDCGTTQGPNGTTVPVSCNKKYLNIAIDLEDVPADWRCALNAQATATNGVDDGENPVDTEPLDNGVLSAAGTNYPFINVAIKDALSCQMNPLGGPGAMGIISASSFIGGTVVKPMCYATDGAVVSRLGAVGAVDMHADPANAELIRLAADFGKFNGFLGRVANCDGSLGQVRNVAEYQVRELTIERAEGTTLDITSDFGGLNFGETASDDEKEFGGLAKVQIFHLKHDINGGYTAERLDYLDGFGRTTGGNSLAAFSKVEQLRFKSEIAMGDLMLIGIDASDPTLRRAISVLGGTIGHDIDLGGTAMKVNGTWTTELSCKSGSSECNGQGDNICEGTNPGGYTCCCPLAQ